MEQLLALGFMVNATRRLTEEENVMRNKTYRFTIAMALVTVICFLVVFPGASKATPKRELWSCYDVG